MDSAVNKNNLNTLWENSTLADGNAEYLEQLYDSYLKDKNSVSEQWQDYFNLLSSTGSVDELSRQDVSHEQIKEQFRHLQQLNHKNKK